MKQKSACGLTGSIETLMSIELDNRYTPFPAPYNEIIVKSNKYINEAVVPYPIQCPGFHHSR